jgi:O-antigen ligase
MKKFGTRFWQIIYTAIGSLIAFIPVYIFLFLRYLLSPTGFWQKLAFGALGIWLLGSIQLILLISLAVWLWFVWTDK